MGAKKKVRHMRDMPFQTLTPAQTVMRDDMARGVHQPQRAGEIIDEVVSGPGPRTLEALGQGSTISDGIVSTEALAIIEELGFGVRTGLSEWAAIQRMIEESYRRGHRDGWHAALRG